MHPLSDSTIAAIATPPGHGGVAVIRISGPRAWEIGGRVFSRGGSSNHFLANDFQHGRFYPGWVMADGDMVDQALLLAFKAPNSYTGEDVIELQCHGGAFLSKKILSLCFAAGAQPAAPGEFTRRAFLSGKLDLTQAESVMDLIAAQGDGLLSIASANLKERSLGQAMDRLALAILEIQSGIVASVDFPDEVEEPDRADLAARLALLLESAEALARASERNRWIREGAKCVLLGLPNSGKSSLFNALLALDRAIVTDIPGTTRDILTETLVLKGVPVTLSDTAGLREADNRVEMLGIERTWQAAADARVVLYVFDAVLGFSEEDQTALTALSGMMPPENILLLANKMDLCPPPTDGILKARLNASLAATLPLKGGEGKAGGNIVDGAIAWEGDQSIQSIVLPVSARTGAGLPDVFAWLENRLANPEMPDPELRRISLNERQQRCLSAMREHLAQARQTLLETALPMDLATVPLSEALHCLNALMGRDMTEELLDEVFGRFCVGK